MKPEHKRLRREFGALCEIMKRALGERRPGSPPWLDSHIADVLTECQRGAAPKTWDVFLSKALHLAILLGDDRFIKAVAASAKRVHTREPDVAVERLAAEVERQRACSPQLGKFFDEQAKLPPIFKNSLGPVPDYTGEALEPTKEKDLIDGTLSVESLRERLRHTKDKVKPSERQARKIAKEVGVELRPRGRPRK